VPEAEIGEKREHRRSSMLTCRTQLPGKSTFDAVQYTGFRSGEKTESANARMR